MPVDLTALNASIAALTAQATATETVTDSAVVVLQGLADQIKAALDADNAIDAQNTAAAQAVVDQVTARFVASASKLGAAIPANTPPVA